MYRFKDGVLKISKIDVPKLDINIMNDLQQSYLKYLKETVYADMKYLEELLQGYTDMADLSLNITVDRLQSQTQSKSQTNQGKHYYPVSAEFTKAGCPVSSKVEILRIPYMDDYGKINVDGSSKVVLSIQRSSDDISFNLKENTFNIAMPYANIRIAANPKSIKMWYGKTRLSMDELLSAMLHEAGDDSKLVDVFANTYILNLLKVSDMTNNRYIYQQLKHNSDILSKLKSQQYRLGITRTAINETFTLDRAVGSTLSRDLVLPDAGITYYEGDLVDEAMVRTLKRNRVGIIYVRDYHVIEGYRFGDAPILVTTIPAGTQNCSLLRQRLPQFSNETVIPVDVDLGVANAILINDKTMLNSAMAEFLVMLGYKRIQVYPGNSSTSITCSFEREICSNYTAQLKDLTIDIPAGRSADEWVYYYKNPNLEPTPMEYLTVHDLLAITSIIGQIMSTGISPLLNRDNSFLKKTLMINDIFSESLRKTMKEFVATYHVNIHNFGNRSTDTNPFRSLTAKWLAYMNKARFLAPIDATNLSAEVSQACHITTLMPTSAEVVDEMRHLAMPFFSRICPYETPAGKKLGLVNTKAIGSRIQDNLLMAPYYKVVGSADGIRISTKVVWLSVKDELGCKFGDQLSFLYDKSGKILNTPILARIPNPDISDEPFIFSTINAYELAGGYVDAYPEQFLSPTAALMPFACSNDPVRISYGLSQVRQAIYLINSKKSRVRTSMYEDIFRYSDTTKYTAPCDGIVHFVNDDTIAEITGDDGVVRSVYLVNDDHKGYLDSTIKHCVRTGDRVKTNQLVAEAYKYPQPFVIRSPFSGTIVGITDDMIVINTGGNSSFIDLSKTKSIAINNARIMGQAAVLMNLHCSVGESVYEGQILADTCMSRDGVYSPTRNPLVAYISNGYNHEDGVCATETAAVNYTSMSAHHIDKKINTTHYKHAHAESIQGFKYCGSNDIVGNIKHKEHTTDNNSSKLPVKATQKANGIPFEYEIVDHDMVSTTYRYHLLGFNKLQPGDKMSGRHGNKGVVSKVLKDSQAPQLLNGKTVEFILNPLGVPSRMILGCIWDAQFGLIAEVLDIEIESDAFNGASPADAEYLMRYVWTLANTDGIGDNITKNYNKGIFDSVCSAFTELPKELHEAAWKNITNIIDWRGCFNERGNAKLYDPETDSFYEHEITIGYPSFNKLMQEADEKVNVRSGLLEEQYARTTSQPQKSDSSAKGQRMAEMELMALAATGCSAVIDEVLNEKSDNEGRRVNKHLQQLGLTPQIEPASCTSRAVENFIYYLEAMGVKVDVPKEIADVSRTASLEKSSVNIRSVIAEQFSNDKGTRLFTADSLKSFGDIED